MLYFVTSNKNKFKEYRKILGIPFKMVNLELAEIQALEPGEIVENKARAAFLKIKKPVFVEDAGVFIEDLNGFPGALIKWVVKTIGLRKLCRIVGRNRKAKVKIVTAFYNGMISCKFKDEIVGTIAKLPRGKTGWLWDKIFIPRGYKKTLAELGPKIKNKIFARKSVLEKLENFLRRIHNVGA